MTDAQVTLTEFVVPITNPTVPAAVTLMSLQVTYMLNTSPTPPPSPGPSGVSPVGVQLLSYFRR